jgi:hypothetical protein
VFGGGRNESAHGTVLTARLDTPDGPARWQELFAQRLTCSKDIFAATEFRRL